MKIRQNAIALATGIAIGIAAVGPMAQAAESWLRATPSTQKFYVDGQQVQLEAYVINDYNYIKLGDLSAKLGFKLTYDGANNSVYIGEAPQKNTLPTKETTDYSPQANPAIFTGKLTREMYNAIRDTVVNRDAILAGTAKPLIIDNGDGFRQAMDAVTVTLGSYPSYEPMSPRSGKLACRVKQPTAYADAVAHTQTFVDRLAGKAQETQIREIAWYVCDRLTYSTAPVSPAKVLATDSVTAGNCMSYASSFQFLCDRVGIPCILVHSSTHQWNKVYVNSRWWNVDLTGLDVAGDTSARGYTSVLRSDLQGKVFQNAAAEVTAFAMEVLAPGSTTEK